MRYLSSIKLALIVHVMLSIVVLMALACTASPAEPTPNIDATVEARLHAAIAAIPTPTPTGLSPEDCVAVSNWKAAAQEYYFDLNEKERIFNAGVEPWLDEVAAAFYDLGNVTLPSQASDSASDLLALMNSHTEELEKLLWDTYSEGLDVFEAREAEMLEANKNIRRINSLMVEECGLEPMRLYQPHPQSSGN